MAQQNTFDIVSQVDAAEISNALNQTYIVWFGSSGTGTPQLTDVFIRLTERS